jgi:hypothetical protein
LWLIASKAKKRSFRGFSRDSGGAGSSFEKASERIVRINVDGRAWLKLVCCPTNSLAQSALLFVIPAQAGIQVFLWIFWIPDSHVHLHARPE